MNQLFSRARTTFGLTSLALSVLIIGYVVFSPRRAFAAVLYWYKGGTDNNWETLPDNWWTDEAHTQQAGSLPTGSDSVVLLGPVAPIVDLATWTAPTAIDSTGLTGEVGLSGPIFSSSYYLSTNMEVPITGNASFNTDAGYYGTNASTISGNAFFHSSFNQGTVDGNAKFYGESSYIYSDNMGIVKGNADFYYGTNRNDAMVYGNATFNSYGYNAGSIGGNSIFNDNSYNSGTIEGDATFNENSKNESSSVVIEGDATFNDNSFNSSGAKVLGNATFNDNSRNSYYGGGGRIYGNVTFNDNSLNVHSSYSGYVDGNATFNGDLSENSEGNYSGVVSGTKTRRYTTDTTTTRDFTDSPWTVLAYNAAVNIAGATYDETTTFKTAYSGSFTPTVSSTVEEQQPNEPTDVSATAGDGQAVVSFTPDELDGGGITFTVTSDPGNITASGASSPITVTGLTNGTEYTFTVTATNSVGSATSTASTGVTPVAAEQEPEEEETPRRRSGGSSVSSRVSNLIAQGNIEAAQQLASQYPNAVTPTVPGCPPGFSCTPTTPTQPVPSPFTFTRNLTVGSTGEDVRSLQQFLNAQGYIIATNGAGSPGNETATFGALTRAALIRYQRANNITPAVGYFGPVTRQKVGE